MAAKKKQSASDRLEEKMDTLSTREKQGVLRARQAGISPAIILALLETLGPLFLVALERLLKNLQA